MIITHKFVSAKPEQVDKTLVGPNEWNDSHVIASLVFTAAADQTTFNPTGSFNALTTSWVFRNGLKTYLNTDWTISNGQVVFNYPLLEGDTVEVIQ